MLHNIPKTFPLHTERLAVYGALRHSGDCLGNVNEVKEWLPLGSPHDVPCLCEANCLGQQAIHARMKNYGHSLGHAGTHIIMNEATLQ